MTPTPESDVILDLATTVDAATGPAGAARDTFSWNLDGDVLRDLLLRAG